LHVAGATFTFISKAQMFLVLYLLHSQGSTLNMFEISGYTLNQCFSTAGPRPGTGPWHQLRVYRAARGSPGICHFSFL